MTTQTNDKAQPAKKNTIQGYELVSQLGVGAYAKVYKVKKNGQYFALKLLEKQKIYQDALEKCVESEIKVMSQLNSKHCIKLIEHFEYRKWICIVLEYCNGGTLLHYIIQQKPGEKECMNIFIQIMQGFAAIHQAGYLHRDLKPDNILINNGIYKIADFGFATTTEIGRTHCGTSYFMSPEIIQHQPHDYRSDLWSMGVILFFMLFKFFPFSLKNRIKEMKKQCIPKYDLRECLKMHQVQREVSDEMCELFANIFVFDKQQRPTFSQIYNNCKQFYKYLNKQEIDELGTQYSVIEKKSNYQKNTTEASQTTFKTIKIVDPTIKTFVQEEDTDESEAYDDENDQDREADINFSSEKEEGRIQIHNNFKVQKFHTYSNGLGPVFTQYSELIGKPYKNISEITNSQADIEQECADEKFDDIGTSFRQVNLLMGLEKSDIVQSKKFQKIKDKYIFLIQKYNFINDCIEMLPNLSLEQNIKSVVNYILCKLLLFFATQLKLQLEKGENTYNFQEFPEFLKSKYYQEFIQNIKSDIDHWTVKLKFYYNLIDKKKCIVNNTLKQLITEDLVETDFNNDLKCQTRKILDIIFKHAYKLGHQKFKQEQIDQTQQNNQNQQPNQNGLNLNNSNNFNNKNLSQNQRKLLFINQNSKNSNFWSSQQIIATSFFLLLCMLINNIFEFQEIETTFQQYYLKNPNLKNKSQFDFWKFTQWIQKRATQEDLVNSIHTVIKAAFGQEVLKQLKNLVEE
ncbi:Protein kinase-like domain [Pseudocohnilembus persalinus]|uniref:Protein kinase-like domain n=1 Tax=Pseudocohnilembus persalinus TaxID=266149 RepID=A0A0V0QLZ8_PSEPJ|nr:Protein kinase-like domain [Pseudocohnilembus persalinus]|eukprot:KRX03238.1 Protein kinase-like domain [Pseudocohnilembus persalinus]